MLRFILKLLALGFLIFLLPSCTHQNLSLMMDGGIENLAWSPDGQYLAIVPADGTIHLWDSSKNLVTQTIASPPYISTVAWSPDSTRLAASSWSGANGMIDLWDIQSGQRTQSKIISDSKATSLGWSSLGSMISVSTPSGIVIWDPDTDLDKTLEIEWGDILNTSWSADGRYIAAGIQDGSIYIWDTTKSELFSKLSYHTDDYIADLSWSPDDRMLAAASCFTGPVSVENCNLILWDPSGSQYTDSLLGGMYEITNVAWSPNGKWIASALTNGDVILYSPHTGKQVRTLSTPAGNTIIAWSPDGKRLAAGSEDGSVLVWNFP
jgi:WD40 repeat protein